MKQGQDAPDACVLCTAVARRLFPGLPHDQVGAKVRSDTESAAEWERACAAVEQEQADSKDNVLPHFFPSADVFQSSECGFMIYQKFGALTEDQVTELTGKTPRQLNLAAWNGSFDQPSKKCDTCSPLVTFCFWISLLYCIVL